MKRIVKYQLLVLFLGILILPMLNSGFKFMEFERKDENRVFRDSLTIGIDHLDDFPEECEEYINDNFSFRTPLLGFYHRIKYTLNTSPHPDKIIIGKQGWCFNAGRELDVYKGRFDFSNKKLEKFNAEWASRKKYFDEKGIKLYWIICPIKHNIYDDMMPFNVAPSSNGKRMNQLTEFINEQIPDLIIDPSERLTKEKAKNNVFYQLDNHWNYRAGYITTEMLLERIREDFPEENIPLAEVQWYDSTLHFGYQHGVLGLDELYEIAPYYSFVNEIAEEQTKYGFESPMGFPYPWEYERRFSVTTDLNGLKILVIRDSFGHSMMPFIKESFSESLFLFDAWRYDLNVEIIDRVKPDIVVYETVETLLESIIHEDIEIE